MRTPEQIYKKYKNFATAVTKDEFLKAVAVIQKEAFDDGYNSAFDDFNEQPIYKQELNETN